MPTHKRISTERPPPRTQRSLILRQRAMRMSVSNRTHSLQLRARELQRVLRRQQRLHLVLRVIHDLAQEHVLQTRGGLFRRVLPCVALECLDEVRVRGREVAVFRVEHPALHVQACLQHRRGVDARCGCSGAGERRARFRLVAEGMVGAGFEELDFDEREFVVEAFEFFQERVGELEGVVVVGLREVEGDEAGFEGLAEECAFGLLGPGYEGFGEGDLGGDCLREGLEEVEEIADCVGRLVEDRAWGQSCFSVIGGSIPIFAVFALGRLLSSLRVCSTSSASSFARL